MQVKSLYFDYWENPVTEFQVPDNELTLEGINEQLKEVLEDYHYFKFACLRITRCRNYDSIKIILSGSEVNHD